MKYENLILAAFAGVALAWWLWYHKNQVAAAAPVQQPAGNSNIVLTPAGGGSGAAYTPATYSGGSVAPDAGAGTPPASGGGTLSGGPAVLYTAGTGGGGSVGAVPSGSNTLTHIGHTGTLPIITAGGQLVPASQVDHNVALSALINSALLKNKQLSLAQMKPNDFIIHPSFLNLQ